LGLSVEAKFERPERHYPGLAPRLGLVLAYNLQK